MLKNKKPIYDSEKCAGCLFKCMEGTCDFLIITGHARSKICPPGDKCTVRAETEQEYYERCRIYLNGAIPPPPGDRGRGEQRELPFDESMAWQMYSVECLNDQEIAKNLGVTSASIFRWRRRNALPTNYRKTSSSINE